MKFDEIIANLTESLEQIEARSILMLNRNPKDNQADYILQKCRKSLDETLEDSKVAIQEWTALNNIAIACDKQNRMSQKIELIKAIEELKDLRLKSNRKSSMMFETREFDETL